MSAEESTENRERKAKFLLGEVIDWLLDRTETQFADALQAGGLQLEADAHGWAVLIWNTTDREGYGGISFVYRPRAFAIKLYEEVEKKFDELTVKCHSSNEGAVKQVLLRDNVASEYREQVVRAAVKVSLFGALGTLLLTMGRTFEHQYKDSLTVAIAVLEANAVTSFEGQTYEEEGENVTVLEIERRVKALVDERVEDVSKQKRDYLARLFRDIPALRLAKGRGGSEPKVDATDEQCKSLAQLYPEVLERWQDFKSQCAKVRWREHIKLDFPDTPDDLLDRLADLDPYISKPSAIALEHAARMCGVDTKGCSESTLKRLHSRGKQLLGVTQS